MTFSHRKDFFHNFDSKNLKHLQKAILKGGQSRVYRCYTTNNGTEPAETANKMYLTTNDKNLTEIEIINTAASEAGIRSKGNLELGRQITLNSVLFSRGRIHRRVFEQS